jgi:hypothetical protein
MWALANPKRSSSVSSAIGPTSHAREDCACGSISPASVAQCGEFASNSCRLSHTNWLFAPLSLLIQPRRSRQPVKRKCRAFLFYGLSNAIQPAAWNGRRAVHWSRDSVRFPSAARPQALGITAVPVASNATNQEVHAMQQPHSSVAASSNSAAISGRPMIHRCMASTTQATHDLFCLHSPRMDVPPSTNPSSLERFAVMQRDQ